MTVAFRMRLLWLYLLSTAGCSGTGVHLEEFGDVYKPKKVEIVWAATNSIPRSLKVFKVLPTTFTEASLSNLIWLAGFKDIQQVRQQLAPALRQQDAYYESPTEKKYIGLSPARGRIYILDKTVIALPRQPIEGVPSEDQALELAFDVLNKVGIEKSQVAKKWGTDEWQMLRDRRERGQRDKSTGKLVKTVTAQGVFLYRALDGVAVNGRGVCGGAHVVFGNRGKVAELEIVWRNLQRKEELPVANAEQLMAAIRKGKAVIQTEIDSAQITKLTITKAVPYYFGENGREVQKSVHPFVGLVAKATAHGNTTDATLYCPLIVD